MTYPTTTFTFAFTLFIGLFSQLALALPTLVPKDVYVPPVTYPTNGTVWTVGEVQTVTWSVLNEVTDYLVTHLRPECFQGRVEPTQTNHQFKWLYSPP